MPPRHQQREAARRNADNLFVGRQQRKDLAKQEAVSASAATDAKTIRLRALRLARDQADRETASASKAASTTSKKKNASLGK